MKSEPTSGVFAYQATMIRIRERFLALEHNPVEEPALARAERLALHVRKIVEGVAFAALSAAEYNNRRTLRDQRTKDADKILAWLAAKGMLRLPSAQRVGPPQPGYPIVLNGAGIEDMSLSQIKGAYSRASALLHERHPERVTSEHLKSEIETLSDDARRLRAWLWLHIMFFRGEGFLLQMGQFGTASFFGAITKVSELPEGV